MRYDQDYDQDRPTQKPIARRVFSLPALISLALAVAFLAFLATRFDVDLGATWQQVRSANPLHLALAVAVHYTTFIFRGARWRLLLRNVQGGAETGPGVLYCSQLLLLSWFANSVVWFRLGDAYRAYLYHEERGASFSRTIGTVLSERLLDTAIIFLLLAVSLPFLLGSGANAAWTVVATVAATAVVLLGLLGLLLLGIVTIRGNRGVRPSWLPSWLTERYLRFREGALGSFRQLPLVTLWGLLGWLAEVFRLYLVTQALGIDLGPALIIFITLANSLLTLAPTPGGLGAVESGVAGLLTQLSTLSTPSILALVLVDRSISYLSIIASGAGLFLLRRIFRPRQAAPAPGNGEATGVEGN